MKKFFYILARDRVPPPACHRPQAIGIGENIVVAYAMHRQIFLVLQLMGNGSNTAYQIHVMTNARQGPRFLKRNLRRAAVDGRNVIEDDYIHWSPLQIVISAFYRDASNRLSAIDDPTGIVRCSGNSNGRSQVNRRPQSVASVKPRDFMDFMLRSWRPLPPTGTRRLRFPKSSEPGLHPWPASATPLLAS